MDAKLVTPTLPQYQGVAIFGKAASLNRQVGGKLVGIAIAAVWGEVGRLETLLRW